MVSLDSITAQRQRILHIAHQHGASDVRVFGSVSKNQATPSSDVDLLVHLDSDRTLLDQIALTQDLEALLNVSVDVVDDDAVHPLIRDDILAHAVTL
jgi:predicted nucleotidyltransferase